MKVVERDAIKPYQNTFKILLLTDSLLTSKHIILVLGFGRTILNLYVVKY